MTDDPDRPAFEAFVTAHGPELVGFARRLTMDHHRGEDIVQDVLARLGLSWSRLGHVADMRAFAFKAVLREFLSWRRRLVSTERATDLADHPGAAVAGVDTEIAARDEVTRALATLRPVQRAVLVLRYHQDLPDAEIAELLGCRESTVRSHARRGLAGLRDHLGAAAPAATGPTLSEGTPR